MIEIHDNVAKIIKNLILSQPFYGLFIMGMNKIYDKGLPADAAVSRNGISANLIINPDRWFKMPDLEKEQTIIHETLHICFGHLFTASSFSDKKLFNIAADCEVNCYINNLEEDKWCTIDSFPELNLEPRLGVREYYRIFSEAKKNNTSPSLNKFLSSPGITNHDWSSFEELSEADQKMMQEQLEYSIKEVAENVNRGRGLIPGCIQEILTAYANKQPPKFNWKQYLRNFVGTTIHYIPKRSKHKVNKRFEEYPGHKLELSKHILCAVDTSGSVSNKELREFFSEIHHIHKTGARVTVIQCDAVIHSIKEYNPKDEIVLKGRGGTEFDPVLKYYNENRKEYTCCIYLTDGECSASITSKGPLLWVLSSNSKLNPSLKGKQIKLN